MMWFSSFPLTLTISYLEIFLLQNSIGALFHKSEWGVLPMNLFNCFNPENELNWIYMRQYWHVSWVDELGVNTCKVKVFRFKMVLTQLLAVFCYLEKEVNWNVLSLEILSWNRDIQDAGSTQCPFLLQSIMDACVYSSSHQEAAAQWEAKFPLLSHRSQFTSSCLLCFSCSSWWLLPRKFSMSAAVDQVKTPIVSAMRRTHSEGHVSRTVWLHIAQRIRSLRTWPNRSLSLTGHWDQNKRASWNKFQIQTKKDHRLISVIMRHDFRMYPRLDKSPVSHYLTALIIWRWTSERSISNKKKGNEENNVVPSVLSCKYQRGITWFKKPDLHLIRPPCRYES